MTDAVLFSDRFPVHSGDFLGAGNCSSKIKEILKQIGVAKDVIRRATIASYEAELNMIIHSKGGELILQVAPGFVRVVSKDIGPGIENIALAMKEGWSTAPEDVRSLGFGAGMGLPNMKKNSDVFDIQSKLGEGTVLTMLFKSK